MKHNNLERLYYIKLPEKCENCHKKVNWNKTDKEFHIEQDYPEYCFMDYICPYCGNPQWSGMGIPGY